LTKAFPTTGLPDGGVVGEWISLGNGSARDVDESNLGSLQEGNKVNLERLHDCHGRFDGYCAGTWTRWHLHAVKEKTGAGFSI